MDEIIKIVFNRNKERKLLTATDVKKICHIILKKKGYNFVKHIKVFSHNPVDSTCAGVYHDENIFFFYNEILDMIQSNFEKFSSVYKIDGANADIYNYFYLNIVFHELAHVRQYARIDNNHDSLETRIFSMFLKLSSNRDFYEQNYSDILTEINANNVSLVTTNYIYSKLPRNFITKNDWQVYQSVLLNTLLYNNYAIINKKDEIISPAERIINCFNEDILSSLNTTLDKCLKTINSINNITLYKKLMLGLPISYLEYSYANLLNDRLNSDDKINVVKKLQKKI